MRVLLVEDNTVEALAIQRELGGRFELRVARTLAEALGTLGQGAWRPDVVVANLDLPDSEGLATLHALEGAARGAPVVVSTGAITGALRRQLDALGGAVVQGRGAGGAVVQGRGAGGPVAHRDAFLHHGGAHSLVAYRIETIAEVDRVTRLAADAAMSRAIDGLLDRLGLGD
ncbi:MAG TPA: hypothetical protein VFY87_13555, partial [Geminicoccaceae bacterium]|nr:hypothetical protein [Geminicoccaceae bacterium]